MELGNRIRQARLAAGLSQRQLCGDTITRNMLSQIENGTARPSMDTLLVLAQRLGKPMSYFLEEQVLSSGNQQIMLTAREAYLQGDYASVVAALEKYQTPDSAFDWERWLLETLSCMELSRQAFREGRLPYAGELLRRAHRAGENTPYDTPALRRERLLMLSQLEPVDLPPDDRELLNRAQGALQTEDYSLAQTCLDACRERENPRWSYLRGQLCFARKDYGQAREFLEKGQAVAPKVALALLEECSRELKDYESAYRYACQRRETE